MNKKSTLVNEESKEFAAIDLGSNSFHMIIVRVVNGSIQVLSRLKQRVQLGNGLDEKHHLSQEAIQRGIDCLALFAERLQGFAPEQVKTVATYTLRRAENSDEFLQAAKQVFPFPIRIISGAEEAKLIYLGVAHTQPETGRKLVVDIGGGSTEMIIGEGFTPLLAESRHMGCVSFTKAFFADGKISEKQFNLAQKTALARIEDLSWEYRHLSWDAALGSSGTIKAISQVIAENFSPDGMITPKTLQQVIALILKFDSMDKLKIPGLSEDRVGVFVAGVAILSAVFENYRIEQMRYSDGALREGVLYSFENQFQVEDIRERTVTSFIKHFWIDKEQGLRVADTAILLAKRYQRWQHSEQVEELLSILLAAALLHEAGMVVNHSGSHKHASYLLQNSELPGFDPMQKKLLATLVRFQMKSLKQLDLLKGSRYHSQDIRALVIILRLAIILNKSRQATEVVQKFALDVNASLNKWELEFEAGYLDRNPLTKNDLNEEKSILQTIGITLMAQ